MVTVQPLTGAVPAVTATFATKPPDHELPTLYVAPQVRAPVALGAGEAVVGRADEGAADDGAADDDADGDGDGDPEDRDAVGVGLVVGGVPAEPVSTTTDSAG